MVVALFVFFAPLAHAEFNFPKAPDLQITPGAVCAKVNKLRYDSNMSYCERNVSPGKKWAIIRRYMQKLNFVINDSNRNEFKIDHYVPLCMGGSNAIENLWPQHRSISEITDKLEEDLCLQLKDGRITQEAAISKMKYAKFHLDEVPALIIEAKQR